MTTGSKPDAPCRTLRSTDPRLARRLCRANKQREEEEDNETRETEGPEFLSPEYWKLPMIPVDHPYKGPYYPGLGFMVYVNQWPSDIRKNFKDFIPKDKVYKGTMWRKKKKTKWFGTKKDVQFRNIELCVLAGNEVSDSEWRIYINGKREMGV